MTNISVLVSGGGTNLQSVIDAIASGKIPDAQIVLVVSSQEDAYALKRAEKAGIQTAVVNKNTVTPISPCKSNQEPSLRAKRRNPDDDGLFRSAHNDGIFVQSDVPAASPTDELIRILRGADTDLVLTLGYMTILESAFFSAYEGRIINIHPALLPRHGGKGFYGRHVHESVLAAGDKVSGATVHYVIEDIDKGETIIQKEVPVKEGDDAESLAARVLKIEHEIIIEGINIHLKKDCHTEKDCHTGPDPVSI
jgi:phosphoribosylglycinamide formyltransferase-1